MVKLHNGTAVPRYFVMVTGSGDFVVQLTGKHWQDMLTGHFVEIADMQQNRPVTDPELDQLKAAGRVEHYTRSYVWVYGMPEPHVTDPTLQADPDDDHVFRVFYVQTFLPYSRLAQLKAVLERANFLERLTLDSRHEQIIILALDGMFFAHFDAAAALLDHLNSLSPDIFKQAVVAFADIAPEQNQLVHELDEGAGDLRTIIAAQTDTSLTAGKHVVVALDAKDDQQFVRELCDELEMRVQATASGNEALSLLEDGHNDLLIMSLDLPDMHGWEFLAKLKEITELRQMPVIVISENAAPSEQSLALTVAKVDIYLVKPVSRARLRHNIWMLLRNRI